MTSLVVTGVAAAVVVLWAWLKLVPTRRLVLVALLLSLVVAVLPGDSWTGLLVVNALLALAVTVDGLWPPGPSGIVVERELPTGVSLGGEGSVTWVLRNVSGRRLRVALADELAPSLRASTRRVRGTVAAQATLRATATLRPARRGLFRPDHVAVRVDGPLGLGALQASRSVPGELRVLPSFRSRDEAELRVRKARLLEVGMRSARGRGAGTEFDQLREYSIDDEFRRIDWAATARTSRPIVRTFRAERNQTVMMLLDNGRVMAGRVDGVPRVEHAMDAMMATTTLAAGLGDRCGLVAFDRQVRAVVPPRFGKGQLGRMVEAVYNLEPALVESDYAGAFGETLARFRRRTMLVVLTDLSEQAVNEWLVPALPLIVGDHVVVVAGVNDPDVVRWASPGSVSDPASAYRRTAAVTALAERERVVANLRRLGATVVDSRPGRLAADLADAYLHIKATGRL
jgi:uncharacterized protein (DUF58 family)